ncbi:MAG TPA: amidohydrolase family protein [Clostridia bacterium]|nr:amidohydrolase family protein [Clostridia bacterium]
MIIDGHAHACGEYYNIESILRVLDSNNTDKVVLCPGEANSKKTYGLPLLSEKFPNKDFIFVVNRIIGFITKINGAAKHINEHNRYVYELFQMCPDKIIQSYWVNPLDNDCLTKLKDDYAKYNFKIIKLHQCWHKFDISNENSTKIIEWAFEQSIPIFIHISTKKQVQAFIQTANKYYNNTFIVAHLIGFEDIYEHVKNSNIYYEVSPPQLIPINKLKIAISKVGAERLILGSDTPYGKNNLRINIDCINSLDISEHEKDLIKGQNMYKLLFSK